MLKDRQYYSLEKHLRLLALCGVPLQYLKNPVQAHQFNFAPTMLQTGNGKDPTVVVSPECQYSFLIELFKNMQYMGESSTYVIGSHPTDQAGYQLAALVTTTYYEYLRKERIYPQIKWIDLGAPDYDFLKSNDSVSLLVVHGLSETSSEPRKLELAKDFLRRGANTTKLALAVTGNILNFAVNKLEVNPDGAFQLLKTTNRIVV